MTYGFYLQRNANFVLVVQKGRILVVSVDDVYVERSGRRLRRVSLILREKLNC